MPMMTGDGQTNLRESLAGTNPFDANSVLKVTRLSVSGAIVTLSWSSIASQRYQIQSNATPQLTGWQDLGTPSLEPGRK